MDKAMRNRNLLGSLAVASLLLSGCAAALGPDGVTPAAFSYQVATTILACWTEHH